MTSAIMGDGGFTASISSPYISSPISFRYTYSWLSPATAKPLRGSNSDGDFCNFKQAVYLAYKLQDSRDYFVLFILSP